MLPPPTPVTTTTTTPPTTTTTTAPTTTTTALPTATATPPTTTTTALPTATATPPTTTTTALPTTTTALPTTTTANTTPPTTTTTATTTTAAPATTVPTTTAAGGGTGATSTTTTTAPPPPTTATAGTGGSGGPGSGGTGTTTTQPPSPTASSVGGQDGGGTGSVSAALTSAPNDGSNLVNPTSVVIAAAALCALAAGLGWWSALGRLLAGTTLGAFLLAFWRRRKVPGPPREVLVISDGTVDRFTWVKPTRGKDPDRYSIEGLVDDSWLVVHEHTTTVTHAEHPVSTFPVATTWRIRASNDHGTGQPSDEVDPVVVTESASFEEGPMSGREDRGSDGD